MEYAKMSDCSICFESITKTTGCCVLSCSHSFHIKCLSKWTSDASTCPLCRHTLSDIELNRPDPPPKPEITRSSSLHSKHSHSTTKSNGTYRRYANCLGIRTSVQIRNDRRGI